LDQSLFGQTESLSATFLLFLVIL